VTAYQIVCTVQEPPAAHPLQAHIVAVGVGPDPKLAENIFQLGQVLEAMDKGHSFYTTSPSTGKQARVEKFTCSNCTRTHIRSSPDALKDNNLDSLRYCRLN
jgi:hypothetical protein